MGFRKNRAEEVTISSLHPELSRPFPYAPFNEICNEIYEEEMEMVQNKVLNDNGIINLEQTTQTTSKEICNETTAISSSVQQPHQSQNKKPRNALIRKVKHNKK